jgi:hypothetical protein
MQALSFLRFDSTSIAFETREQSRRYMERRFATQ